MASTPSTAPDSPVALRAGDEVAPGVAQDIQVVVREKPHDRFVREGADLHLKHAISLADAICGLSHLDVRSLDAAPRVM